MKIKPLAVGFEIEVLCKALTADASPADSVVAACHGDCIFGGKGGGKFVTIQQENGSGTHFKFATDGPTCENFVLECASHELEFSADVDLNSIESLIEGFFRFVSTMEERSEGGAVFYVSSEKTRVSQQVSIAAPKLSPAAKRRIEDAMAVLVSVMPGPLGVSGGGIVFRPRYCNYSTALVGEKIIKYTPLIDSRAGRIHVSGGEVFRSPADIVTNICVACCLYQACLVKPFTLNLLSVPNPNVRHKAETETWHEIDFDGKRIIGTSKEIYEMLFEQCSNRLGSEFEQPLERWRLSIEAGSLSLDARLKLPYFRYFTEAKMGVPLFGSEARNLVMLFHSFCERGYLEKRFLPDGAKAMTCEKGLWDFVKPARYDDVNNALADLFRFSFDYARLHKDGIYHLLRKKLQDVEPTSSPGQVRYAPRALARIEILQALKTEKDVPTTGNWMKISGKDHNFTLSEDPNSRKFHIRNRLQNEKDWF
jgi:hypothetical protein